MNPKKRDLLRSLPAVTALLEHPDVVDWLSEISRATVVASLQTGLDAARQAMREGNLDRPIAVDELLALAEEDLIKRTTPSLRRVINATGIVLHTGLGRAPLCDAAIEAVVDGASSYCNLEYDLETGSRGHRTSHVVDALQSLTGAEAATVVNNNAAATLLILRTFAEGREAVVSRGQLIEIGGSFRLPDIMRASGAALHEVGTTNRTRLKDYEIAIGDATGMLLRVHTSNYRVVGFTEEVAIGPMVELAHRYNLIAVDDLGSGALFDFDQHGITGEPSVRASVDAGADLVCFSGDKLLGGPQCGIIVGRKSLVDQLDAHPLMRTYRLDKMILLALDATLRRYLDEEDAWKAIPTLAMLTVDTDTLASRARALAEQLEQALPGEHFFVSSDVAYAGGGAMPTHKLDTVIVQWRPTVASADATAAALRTVDPPIITRIRDDAVCFDLRTIPEVEFESLVAAVSSAMWGDEPPAPSNGISLPVL